METIAPPKVVLARRMPTTLLHEYARQGRIELVEHAPASAAGSEEVDDAQPAPREWLLQHIRGAQGIVVVLGDKVDQELIAAAGHQLKVVSTMSVGYDHIDTSALRNARVRLGNTPTVLNAAVADTALMLALMVTRQAARSMRIVREGNWKQSPWAPLAFCGPSLRGKTIGFFGFGAIAQTVALRLAPFGIKQICFTTSKPKPFQPGHPDFEVLCSGDTGETFLQETKAGRSGGEHSSNPFPTDRIPVENVPDLLELAEQSDLLFVLASYSQSTHHAIGSDVFARMKPNSFLINASRAGLVKTDDLVQALRQGKIAGAGLDVLEGEPNVPASHPLLADETIRDRVVLLPHIGSATTETRKDMADLAAINVLAGVGVWEGGNEMPTEVNL